MFSTIGIVLWWILLNIIWAFPLIFIDNIIYANTPYIWAIVSIFTHTLLYRKLFHGMPYAKKFFSCPWVCVGISLFAIDIICGTLSVYLLICYGFNAWANKSLFSITYRKTLMPEFGITVMVMPVAIIYIIHFGLFYLANKIISRNYLMVRVNIQLTQYFLPLLQYSPFSVFRSIQCWLM